MNTDRRLPTPAGATSRRRVGLTLAAATTFALLGTAAGTPAAVGSPPTDAGGLGGEFVVEDAVAQFAALKHHGEALAWRNDESAGAIDPSIFDHYQGIARHPDPGLPVFYISQSDDDDGGTEGGYVHVVQYGSRAFDGERLRSNVQAIGADTEEVTPASADTWVRSVRFDGSLTIDGRPFPAYKHPGAPAVVDDILLVPIDQPIAGSSPTGQIVLFDLSTDRLNPEPIHAITLEHGIDNLAVTRYSADSFLIWTNGDGGEDINIYETSTVDLRDDALGLDLLQAWSPGSGMASGSWPTGTGAHQSTGLVREPDGSLFLIGMRHPGGLPFVGNDYAELYSIVEQQAGNFELTALMSRELNCVYDGGGGPVDMRLCNFTAAGGTYVSPSGELILYAMPHDDEDGFDPDIARMAEFRHRDVSRENSPLRTAHADAGGPYTVGEGSTITLRGSGHDTRDRPWVELYDDDGFRDRSIVVDYDDRQLLELHNFNFLDGFNDKTSSVRWRAPVGVDIQLFDDDTFRDRSIILRGTGQTEWIGDLGNHGVEPGVVEHVPARDPGQNIGFGDKTSSMRFLGSPPPVATATLEWDLDGDGVFETSGPDPVFDAGNLDGPVSVTVALRVRVAGVVVATDSTTVDVENVAPEISITPYSSRVDEGSELSLRVDLVEPADADTVDVTIGWGDGSTTELELGVARSITTRHRYVDDDPSATPVDSVVITASATDDDGGVDSTSTLVDIANVAPVAVIDELASGLPFTLTNVPVHLVGSFTDVGVADVHADPIVDWGDGSSETTPVGSIAATHTYLAAGTFDVSLTVVDDDTGIGIDTNSLDVLTPEQALPALVDLIDDLRLAHPGVRDLDVARDRLVGPAGGRSESGALDKLENGQPHVALLRLEQSVESLVAAEADGVDTSIAQQLATLIADSIAHSIHDEVLAANPSPSGNESRRIDEIGDHLDDGRDAEASEDWLTAVGEFRAAVQGSVALLP